MPAAAELTCVEYARGMQPTHASSSQALVCIKAVNRSSVAVPLVVECAVCGTQLPCC